MNRFRLLYTTILLLISFYQAKSQHLLQVDLTKTSPAFLAAEGLEVDHGEILPGRYWYYQFSDEERARLEELKVKFKEVTTEGDILSPRDKPCRPDMNIELPTPAHFRLGKMGGYYQYEEMISILDSMHMLYPQLISSRMAIDTFTTVEGNTMWYMRISNNPEQTQSKPKVLYTALHHAREPMSLTQLTMFMWYLLEHYDTDSEIKEIIDNTELYFIPCVNPDGYQHNQKTNPNGGGFWRKNRSRNGNGTIVGVDLNRNYGDHWGIDDVGSSPVETSATYRGKTPFSEIETKSVKFMVEKYKFDLALNYHTYGNYLIHPYGYTNTPCPDDAAFKNMGKSYALSNEFKIGTGQETVGYFTNGDSDDWMYEGIPGHKLFAFTPEVGYAVDGFWPKRNKIEPISKSTLKGNIQYAKFALGYYEFTPMSDGFITGLLPNSIPFYINKIGIETGLQTISFKVLSNNAILEKSNFDFLLQPAQRFYDSLMVSATTGISFGDEIKIEATRLMSGLIEKDTFSMVYANSLVTKTDHAEDITKITTNGWGLDNEIYFTPESAYSDSPGTYYKAGVKSYLVLKNKFKIPIDTPSFLSYYATWDIEPVFDYAQVFAIDGIDTIPLCGKYSVLGGVFQDQERPIYQGKSPWVREQISLEDFQGREISVGFLMTSDSIQQETGITIDDISVYSPSRRNLANKHKINVDCTIYPNPLKNGESLRILSSSELVNVQLISLSGKILLETSTTGSMVNFDIPTLQPGVYFIKTTDGKGLNGLQKLIIQ